MSYKNRTHATNIELFTSEFNQNPYPTFSKLRQEDPIHQTLMPSGHYSWIVTRYEDAVAVLKDPRFIKDYTHLLGQEEREEAQANSSIFVRNMLFSDPPDHKRLRGLVQKAFTPKMIEGLRGRIEEITNELLDNVQEKGQMNLIDDFAFPLPIIVICEMLGVPSQDRDKFRTWSNTLVEASNNPEKAEQVETHMTEFVMYLKQLCAERRQNPKDDMISKLIQSEEEGDSLSEQELYGVISLLIIAGHETTVNLITNGVFALLENPEQKEQLKNDPDLIDSALEEFLRYNGPVEFSTDRWASEMVELRGKTIAKGDHVIVALDSANRDPEQFEDPDLFDITRGKSKHLAFGKGIHFCLGAPLARLEAEVAVTTLLFRMPEIQLNTVSAALEWRPGILMRGLKELPVSF
ncbi:cytochrome P450 [Halobacillus shinanisalinarum]|uniref:Cytochrome P450 n=1 Tax=Halobacillus shinanisalinarum TaxID=2932258 RepID=A0ABY4GZY8_9BACI|nr:cytochrome P450 [Halobacillus shinanisalinarum]UOQ93464.1 cytochrome P450 [Halobacillus shinanisalinarum]